MPSTAYLIDNADSALIWRGPMKMSALKDMIQNTEWGELDYLVIDCPPAPEMSRFPWSNCWAGWMALWW